MELAILQPLGTRRDYGIHCNFFLVFVGGGVLYALQSHAVTSPGRALHQRFVDLGNVMGKSKDEIIAQVGLPTCISSLPDGKTLLQWQVTGCHMALLFNGESCEGITHEYLHQG